MNTIASRFEDRAQESDRGAFAVCPGNMDDRWQLLFGMIEASQQQPHAVKRKIDTLGMQRGETRDYGLG
jgi:hypothetical protein